MSATWSKKDSLWILRWSGVGDDGFMKLLDKIFTCIESFMFGVLQVVVDLDTIYGKWNEKVRYLFVVF